MVQEKMTLPIPKGHYSLTMQAGGLLWISGLVGNQEPGCNAADQARAALRRLQAVLEQGGHRLDQVVSTTVFTTDPLLWADVDGVYREVFGDHRPARAIVPGARFDGDCLLEIQAVATV